MDVDLVIEANTRPLSPLSQREVAGSVPRNPIGLRAAT